MYARRHFVQAGAALFASHYLPPVAAQLRIEVTGVGATQLPIAIAPLKGEELTPQKISAILRADLERSGVFNALNQPSLGALVAGMDESSRPDTAKVRALGAESLLLGSVSKLADGRYDVRIRLWDAVRGIDLGGQKWLATLSELRLISHRVADWVYEKLTGERGVAASRITYITKNQQRYTLWVADADGENAATALVSGEPIISPTWSPNGQQLAYVSFESRKPVVYAHEVATGKRRMIANFKGSNSAPAWSPDGQQLLVTLSRDGGSQLYLVPATGTGELRRLSHTSSIDTEAAFAPDGRSIYFVSDRGASPQIYRMSLDGSAVQRVSFSGGYNISPAISPDGQKLAYISRTNGAFKLVVQDVASGSVSAITDTAADESPSFSANSRQIIYATQVNNNGRWQEALMMTTVDGRVKSKLTAAAGDIREPDWGPRF